jgi:hypothetical protein
MRCVEDGAKIERLSMRTSIFRPGEKSKTTKPFASKRLISWRTSSAFPNPNDGSQ